MIYTCAAIKNKTSKICERKRRRKKKRSHSHETRLKRLKERARDGESNSTTDEENIDSGEKKESKKKNCIK